MRARGCDASQGMMNTVIEALLTLRAKSSSTFPSNHKLKVRDSMPLYLLFLAAALAAAVCSREHKQVIKLCTKISQQIKGLEIELCQGEDVMWLTLEACLALRPI